MGWKEVVREECLADEGLLAKIRTGRIDEAACRRLLDALREGTEEVESKQEIDRMTVACLFGVPYEIENTAEHFAKQRPGGGKLVTDMAESLRLAIHEFLWAGLDDQYK